MKKRIAIILTLMLSLVTVIGSTGCSKEKKLEKEIQGYWRLSPAMAESLDANTVGYKFDDGVVYMFVDSREWEIGTYEVDGDDIIVSASSSCVSSFMDVSIDGQSMHYKDGDGMYGALLKGKYKN